MKSGPKSSGKLLIEPSPLRILNGEYAMNCPNCNTYTENSNFCSRQCCATYWSVYKAAHQVERFWAKAEIKHFGSPFLLIFGCWQFKTKKGYALRSREAWKYSRGQEVPEGLYVNHHCDNGLCINPWHVYAGTQRQNMLDKYRRGRNDTNRDFNNARLTLVEVKKIRKKWDANFGLIKTFELKRMLARKYKTTPRIIGRIGNRETWQHILDEID